LVYFVDLGGHIRLVLLDSIDKKVVS
jgi:hypothetical protein